MTSSLQSDSDVTRAKQLIDFLDQCLGKLPVVTGSTGGCLALNKMVIEAGVDAAMTLEGADDVKLVLDHLLEVSS